MKYSFTVILYLLVSPAFGQVTENYLEGYVVLLNGDTLRGKVMDRDVSAFGGLLKKIRFKPHKGWKKRYKPGEIKAYHRGEDNFLSIWLSSESRFFRQDFYSRPGQGEQVFIKIMHQGSIDLYHWEYTDEDNSTVDFIPLLKKPEAAEMVRATQGILGLKRKRLAEYFSDCPRLSSALLNKEITTVNEVIMIYESACLD